MEISIKNNDLKSIKEIISKFFNSKDYKLVIFGSRARRTARKFSDYDIGVIGRRAVPLWKMALVEEELEDSDLPYRVEVVDFALVSDDFKKVALKNFKKL